MSIELKVPSVGESISEVMVTDWTIQEGERIHRDDPLVELETDKATMEVPSPVSGRLIRIVLKAGDSARIGDVLGYLEEENEASGTNEEKESHPDRKRPPVNEVHSEKGSISDADKAMPAAQHPIEQNRLSVESERSTGPDRQPSIAAFRQEEIKPLSPMRLKIAERLVNAQNQAALLTTFNEADLSAVMALRKKHQESFQEKFDVRLGLMSFFVKAVIEGLKTVPQLNARIEGKRMVFHHYYDIGVAVASGKGLVVPVLRNAERMSFAKVEKAIRDFALRAKENKIELSELEGGTFTITNGGLFGSLLSTPILNPPQSGILGMHTIQDRPVVRDGQVVIRPMMYLALTYDHRIADGRESAAFLTRVRECIEDPARMLMEI